MAEPLSESARWAQLDKHHRIAHELVLETDRQLEKWGIQNHPIGNAPHYAKTADIMRAQCDGAAEAGECTWRHILLEEWWEAMGEEDPAKVREELVQAGAVIVSMISSLDRNGR